MGNETESNSEIILQSVFGYVKKDADIYKCFLAALQYYDNKIEVVQKEVAEAIGTTAQNLNAIIKEREVTGGKPAKAGTKMQERIAKYFGYSFIEFLQLGALILEGIEPKEKTIGQSIEGDGNTQNNNQAAGGDIITTASDLSPEISELASLLHEYASRAEIMQLINKYRGVKESINGETGDSG